MIFNKLINFFNKNKPKKDIEVIGETDPNIIAMIKACYNTNKPVSGEIDKDGNLIIKEIK